MSGGPATQPENSESSTSPDVYFDIDTKIENAAEWMRHTHEAMDARIAHQGVMVAKMVRGIALAEAAQRFAVTGDKGEFDIKKIEDSEMGVSIGNRYNVQLPDNTPAPQPTVPASANNWLGPAIIGASSLLGLGTAGYLIGEGLKPDPVVPVQPRPEVDYDVEAWIKPGFVTD
jgi:hypothetical protein